MNVFCTHCGEPNFVTEDHLDVWYCGKCGWQNKDTFEGLL